MSHKSLGEQLLNSGDLTYRRNTKNYQSTLKLNFIMEWEASSDIFEYSSGEGILIANSKKLNYKSPIHFAFRVMAFHIGIDNRFDLLKMCEEYENTPIEVIKAHKKIQIKSLSWWEQYNKLILNYSKCTLIWNTWDEFYMVFENDEDYLCWSWRTTA